MKYFILRAVFLIQDGHQKIRPPQRRGGVIFLSSHIYQIGIILAYKTITSHTHQILWGIHKTTLVAEDLLFAVNAEIKELCFFWVF